MAKRQHEYDVNIDPKKIKINILPIHNLDNSTKPSTPEQEIEKLSKTINTIIPTINDIIKNMKKTAGEINKTNTRVQTVERTVKVKRTVKYIHKYVHKNSITIRNLGVDLKNEKETKEEIAKLVAHILSIDHAEAKSYISDVESIDGNQNSTPTSIKINFNTKDISTKIIEKASRCKDFVRKNQSIKYKIFIQEYKSPIETEHDMELSHAIQLIHLYYGLLKKKDPSIVTPTVTKSWEKLKVGSIKKDHLSAINELTSFDEEEFIQFRQLKRSKKSTEELEKWITTRQPNKFT
uniref:Uncharacterized protein n=1 Tax=Panagrolaimus superbus TaxID=310955 RepID=A0A914YAR7_9BILA